jgi:starch phosphorylase
MGYEPEEIRKLEDYVKDPRAKAEFMEIKYQNKLRLIEYIRKYNGIDVNRILFLMFR